MRALAIACMLSWSAVARADVPPPDDWKDPCISANITAADDCVRCVAPAFKDAHCYAEAKAAGRSERCRGWNYAMLCKPTTSTPEPNAPTPPAPPAASPPTPAPPPKKSACAGGDLSLFGLGLLALFTRVRR